MWQHILQDQLIIDEEEFWSCVVDGILPSRGVLSEPTATLPLSLVWQLTRTAGISEDVVAAMSKEQAIQALNDYWMNQGK